MTAYVTDRVMSGSPFAPVTHERTTHVVAQANNALVFPGLGLGTIVSRARMVTDGMLTAAAETVAGLVDATTPGAPLLPQVDDLRAVSSAVGAAVARAAEADGAARVTEVDWAAAVTRAIWEPNYRPVVPEGGRG